MFININYSGYEMIDQATAPPVGLGGQGEENGGETTAQGEVVGEATGADGESTRAAGMKEQLKLLKFNVPSQNLNPGK